MSIFISIASISSDSIKAILILGFAAVILAGPLVYRILSGEKFGWFRDPRFNRPGKKQWQQLRNKADQIIEGKVEVDTNELCKLISEMQIEIMQHKRKKRTIEYENDCERITVLSEKLQDMDLRVEPFDSFAEYLKEDGLIEQAQKLHNMVHDPYNKSLTQFKKEFLDELAKIRDENWDILGQDTRAAWKQSVKLLKHKPLRSLYVYGALIVIGLGLRFYHSIVEDKGYEFYRKHPIWIVVFAIIIGLPALILAIKFLVWKYSMRENPYQSNLSEK
jgi:protein-tyrosine-phosphatase